MGNVSRPLLGVLVATVAFFALWIVALKPSSSSNAGGSSSHPLGAYSSAINRAKGVQAVVNHGAAAAAGTAGTAGTPSSHRSALASAKAQPATKPSTAAKPHIKDATNARPASRPATPRQRLDVVEKALAAHKVLAALFYNPAASDDQAVKQELSAIPTRSGKVVKLTIPLSELSSYTIITNQVPVAFSPTLVVINRAGHASTIVGFADTFEITQRIAGAL